MCHSGYQLAVDQISLFQPDLMSHLVTEEVWSDDMLWHGLGNKTDPKRQLNHGVGQCDAMWMFDTSYIFTPSYADGPCNVNAVSGQLFSLPVGWPVRNEYAPTINYYILRAINSGKWAELQALYMPEQKCEQYKLPVNQVNDLEPMMPLMFTGPVLILALGIVTALGLHAAYNLRCTRTREAAAAPKTDKSLTAPSDVVMLKGEVPTVPPVHPQANVMPSEDGVVTHIQSQDELLHSQGELLRQIYDRIVALEAAQAGSSQQSHTLGRTLVRVKRRGPKSTDFMQPESTMNDKN